MLNVIRDLSEVSEISEQYLIIEFILNSTWCYWRNTSKKLLMLSENSFLAVVNVTSDLISDST